MTSLIKSLSLFPTHLLRLVPALVPQQCFQPRPVQRLSTQMEDVLNVRAELITVMLARFLKLLLCKLFVQDVVQDTRSKIWRHQEMLKSAEKMTVLLAQLTP